MTDRDKIIEQLSAYLDGELSDAERREVAEAVDRDPELAGELRRLTATRDMLRNLPREAPSADFVQRVLSRAERQHLTGEEAPRQGSSFWWYARHIATAAVLIIAVGVGITVVATLWTTEDFADRYAVGPAEPPSSIPREGELAYNRVEKAPAAPREREAEDEDIRALDNTAAPFTESPEHAAGEFPIRRDVKGTHARRGKAGEQGDGEGIAAVPAGVATPPPVDEPADAATGVTQAGAVDLSGLAEEGDLDDVSLVGTVTNVTIYTDDLLETQQQVERVLASNGIQPLDVEIAQPALKAADDVQARGDTQANFYQAQRLNERQVQVVAFVTPDQQQVTNTGLIQLRRRQRVTQAPMPTDAPMDVQFAKSGEILGVNTKLPETQQPATGEGRGRAGEDGVASTEGDAQFARGIRVTGPSQAAPVEEAETQPEGSAGQLLQRRGREASDAELADGIAADDAEQARQAEPEGQQIARQSGRVENGRTTTVPAQEAPPEGWFAQQGQALARAQQGRQLNTLIVTLNFRPDGDAHEYRGTGAAGAKPPASELSPNEPTTDPAE